MINVAWSQGWSNVDFTDWFPIILHKKKWFSIVQSIFIGLWLNESAIKSYLLYFRQNWLIFLHFKPVKSVLQIPSHTNTDYWYLEWSYVHLGTDLGNIFSLLIQVIIIKWWIIKRLKTLFLSQFIGNQSVKCTLLHHCVRAMGQATCTRWLPYITTSKSTPRFL